MSTFIENLNSQINNDQSALRQKIASIVLKEKNESRATISCINALAEDASRLEFNGDAKFISQASGILYASIHNAIFYNKSTTMPSHIQHHRQGGKSPKFIADEVMTECIQAIKEKNEGDNDLSDKKKEK